MKKLYISLIFFSSVLFVSSLSSQTITSNKSGGIWENTGTWVGGTIPGVNNDVIIDGTVSVTSSNSSCNNLTINSGGVIQNGGSLGWVTFTVNGNISNNGTIRNNPSGNELWIQAGENIVNNGVWENRGIYLESKKAQYLSQAQGKFFDCELHKHSASGYTDEFPAAASSDLSFNKIFDLYGVLSGSGYEGTLDMAGHSITLQGTANVLNGTVKKADNLYFYDDSKLTKVTFSDAAILHGNARIVNNNVIFEDDVTIEDTLENGGDLGWVTLTINGDIINNGTIRNNTAGNELWIQAGRNITNNGIWKNRGIYLESKRIQYLAQAQGKMFECELHKHAEGGYTDTSTAIASTDLTFTKIFDLYGVISGSGYEGILNMAGHSLTLRGTANVFNGTVRNTGSLYCYNESKLSNVTFTGSTNLYGTVKIYDSNVYFMGDCIVRDTLENGGNLGWVTLHISGNIINNGLVRDNTSGNELWTEVTGNISGSGEYKNSETYLLTGGSDRRIAGNFYKYVELKKTGSPEAGIIKSGGDIYNYGELKIRSAARFEISSGTTLYQKGVITDNGEISNKSIAVSGNNIAAEQQYVFFNFNANVSQDSRIDSIAVFSYGNQVPASFGNGVKSWWRVKQYPENVQANFTSVSFYYEEEQLGANDETTLQVFHSADSGKSWKQISTSLNTTRNTDKNYLIVTDIPAYGDYILSSNANPFSVKPNVIVSVIGRTKIRIGPPNRYTVFYVNNSDIPTDDFIITLGTGYKTHIKQAEFYHDNGDKEVVPIDSMQFENEDTSAVFYIAGLQPHEERTFDVTLTADRLSIPEKITKTMFEPFTMIATAAIVYVGCKTIDYIGDKARDKIDKWEVLTPEQKKIHDRTFKTQVREDLAKDKSRGIKVWTLRKVGVKIIEKSMGVVGGTVETVAAITRNVKKVGDGFRVKMWQWLNKESGLYGVEEVPSGNYNPDVSGISKKMEGVTSWDPNEKTGPGGYGNSNHISQSGRMSYQILFENKKEATAPAWKIVIVDTLRPELDPETVEFGKASHPGFTMTRDGNIIKWEIEGIELPPNVNPPEGEGWVAFSVNTKGGLESGTVIRNTATITFDVNKPISTNEVINTLDFEAPVTVMNKTITVLKGDSIEVSWQADDPNNGSGVNSTTLFCSVDGGAYEAVGVTNMNSLKLKAAQGSHNYSFYSIATDNVGNSAAIMPDPAVIDVVADVKQSDNMPKEFSLSQNYPNPFNPSTTISFAIPAEGKVVLKIYDILGREVKTLINEVMKAGYYYKIWMPQNLASGVYIYRLSSNKKDLSRKMIFLK